MTLRDWIASRRSQAEEPAPARLSIVPPPRPRPRVRPDYLPLYSYLEHRYASIVVLSFQEVEALLGFALPEAARLEEDWWTTVGAYGVPDGNAVALVAGRTATANLAARNVRFERHP
jgi:hypothetical protein